MVDVPPKLSSRVRVLSTGNARKNDALDATFTALAALRNDRLASVQPEDGPEGHAEILRLLSERREDLVCERTRALNRLHVLLRDLLSDPVGKQLSANAAAKLLRRARPKHPAGRVAPIEASSGEVVRHRLSLAGNRRLNQVMHMIAVCQARSDPRGGAYHRKKLAEGKSRREAIRCLKRRVSDAVYGALVADSGSPSLASA